MTQSEGPIPLHNTPSAAAAAEEEEEVVVVVLRFATHVLHVNQKCLECKSVCEQMFKM
jgi:hypothetical protein